MKKNWKDLDLKKSSIFDLTDDLDLIRKCIDDDGFVLENKKEYLLNLDDTGRFYSFNAFSILTDDNELEKYVNELFYNEFKKNKLLFNE